MSGLLRSAPLRLVAIVLAFGASIAAFHPSSIRADERPAPMVDPSATVADAPAAIGDATLASVADSIVVKTQGGDRIFEVEWALTPDQRARGLMFRESMPADHGMIFDFGEEQSVDFWMENTPLPLDMLFIAADGTIRRIERNAKPFSRTIIPSGAPVRYVLEINGGLADALGIKAGDRMVIPAP